MEAKKKPVIGLPRAMLYYRCRTLWHAFFDELGVQTVVSGPTDRVVLEHGSSRAIDEACLSLKIFLGHVEALCGKCDYIFIPRVSSFGRHRNMCTRFEALPDLAMNVFRDSGQRFLTCDLDVLQKKDEAAAFLDLGQKLGFPTRVVRKAYKTAKKAEQTQYKRLVRAQEQLYKADGLKILIAAHSYVVEDPYIGKTVTAYLKKAGAIPIRADLVDREEAIKRSGELSYTCKWEMSREIVGSIVMHSDKVDGIILLSAFPCGPDSMVNELIARRVKRVPMLNLVLDSQSGTAVIETRLESFIDIIRFKGGQL